VRSAARDYIPALNLWSGMSSACECDANPLPSLCSEGKFTIGPGTFVWKPRQLVALIMLCVVWGARALSAFAQTQAVHPADPAAIFQNGQQALASGDLDFAETAFRRVLKLDPQSAAAYANLGVVAMRRKNWEQALVELRKAEKLAPQMTGVRLNIGLVEYKRGNYPDAIAPFASVLREQPD
jgi:tetratricopeptide (TPR) repeat protein